MKCRGCGALIVANGGTWWTTGTRATATCYGANGEWMTHIPDLSLAAVEDLIDADTPDLSLEAVERFIDA